MSALAVFGGIGFIVCSYGWVLTLARLVSPKLRPDRTDAILLGKITGVYLALCGVAWLLGY